MNIAGSVKKISFLITVYNQKEELKKCIDYIIGYDGDDIEIVVSDDCSNEDLKTTVLSYHDSRIRYYRNFENLGHDGNILEGIKRCKGEFVFLLRTRDYVIYDMIPKIIEIINKYPEVSYISGTCLDDDGLPRIRIYEDKLYKKGVESLEAKEQIQFHPSGSLFKRELVDIELMKLYHSKFIEHKMWFMVDELIRYDLSQKGSFFLIHDPIWIYTYTERNTKKSVQPQIGGHLYTQKYTFQRYKSALEFINFNLDEESKSYENTCLFKRWLNHATWGHKSRMENEVLIEHYGMSVEEVDVNTEREKFIQYSNKLDKELGIDNANYTEKKDEIIKENIDLENMLLEYKKNANKAMACSKSVIDKFKLFNSSAEILSRKLFELGYKKIGIYGAGYLGRLVWNNLKNSEIVKVEFISDKIYKTSFRLCENKMAISPNEINLYECDCLLVTPVQYFNEIQKELSYSHMKLVNINDLI